MIKFESNVYSTYARNFWGFTNRCKSFSYFPSKDSWIFRLALDDCRYDAGGEKPRAAPSYGFGLHQPCAPVAAQDLADAPVGYLERRTELGAIDYNYISIKKRLVMMVSVVTKHFPRCRSLCEQFGLCAPGESWRFHLGEPPPRPAQSSSFSWTLGEVCRWEMFLLTDWHFHHLITISDY